MPHDGHIVHSQLVPRGEEDLQVTAPETGPHDRDDLAGVGRCDGGVGGHARGGDRVDRRQRRGRQRGDERGEPVHDAEDGGDQEIAGPIEREPGDLVADTLRRQAQEADHRTGRGVELRDVRARGRADPQMARGGLDRQAAGIPVHRERQGERRHDTPRDRIDLDQPIEVAVEDEEVAAGRIEHRPGGTGGNTRQAQRSERRADGAGGGIEVDRDDRVRRRGHRHQQAARRHGGAAEVDRRGQDLQARARRLDDERDRKTPRTRPGGGVEAVDRLYPWRRGSRPSRR